MNHNTTWSVWEAVKNNLLKNRAESEEFDNFVHTGGVYREQTRKFSFKLESYKGKNTKKYLQVSIYRFQSGRYELVSHYL